MITITKPSKMLYPVHWVYFAENPSSLPVVRPWDIVVYKQANEAVKEYLEDRALLVNEFYTLLTDLTQPVDRLWNGLNETRKHNIRQMSKGADSQLDIGVNQLPVSAFYEHFCTFSQMKGFGKPSYRALNIFVKHCDVIHITYQGKCCAIRTVISDVASRVRCIHYVNNFDPSISGQVRGRISAYLIWWEMQYYKAKGLETYDWGGIFPDPSSPSYGITEFKESFGGKRHQDWDIVLAGDMLKPLSNMILRHFS